MPAEVVVDASIAAKWFIPEEGSDAARDLALTCPGLIAPEFVLAELANVAAKRLMRGHIDRQRATDMVGAAAEAFTELVPCRPLVARAFELARAHGFSVYDALYLALAELRGVRMVTADAKLVSRAGAAGLGHLLAALGESLS